MRGPTLLALCLVLSQSACLERARLNSACTWTSEPAARLGLSDRAQQRHVTTDAQLAEALGIRYGDSFRRTQSVESGSGGGSGAPTRYSW